MIDWRGQLMRTRDTLRQFARDRADAEASLAAVRQQLPAALHQGQAEGLTVTEMARLAGISRETAHLLLREMK